VTTRSRSLRRLVPDPELFDRFVAGESSRSLGRDYGVAHTTILRDMRRPEAAVELRAARRRLRGKWRARAAERADKRQAEADVRRRAREEARRDRELDTWYSSATARASEYEVWLDQREAPRYLSSKERVSVSYELAEKAVSAGGGVEEVIEATGLRTWQHVYRLISAQVVARALTNARGRRTGQLPTEGFRRLGPDAALITRRAAGEPLRSLAEEYEVSHTTLSRYFRRPAVAKELRSRRREQDKQRRRDARGEKTVTSTD
jgi:DNA-binding transcriptional MocR family regulator